jgi:methionyl-tRNA formyltransferase
MNIAVISDNLFLLRSFKEIIAQHDFKNHSFVFFSTSKEISNKDSVSLIDVANEYKEKIVGKYNLVFSLHCKQLFPAELIKAIRCINIHPGFSPYNKGWYPQVFSIIDKQPAGATIHEMDEKIDNGPVIVQKKVDINAWDTSLDVYNKIIAAELDLLRENIGNIIENKYNKAPSQSAGSFNSAKDFKNLCELDMDEKRRIGDTIDLLRALTHPPYNNAFFIDKATNKKVYVEVRLKTADHE